MPTLAGWTAPRVDLAGRHPNRVQRRLTDPEVDNLVNRYKAGATVEERSFQIGVHRAAVMTHLEHRSIPRRAPRKLTDHLVAKATPRYTSGETLAEVAATLDIASSTITRELRLAGIPIRRRGRRTSG